MENLLITAICHDSNVFNELTKLVSKHECHIRQTQLFSIGSDYTLNMQIAGNWSAIAKIEAALPLMANRLNSEIIFKRSPEEKIDRYFLPYQVEIVAIDQPGIVYEISEFFNTLQIHLQRLETLSDTHQQTPILRMQMRIDIPADSNIADIREQFLIFCDELNLDGMLEPKEWA